jgi:hypothetical protein
MSAFLHHIDDATITAVERLLEDLAADTQAADRQVLGAIEKDAIQIGDRLVVVEGYITSRWGFDHVAYAINGQPHVQGDPVEAVIRAGLVG